MITKLSCLFHHLVPKDIVSLYAKVNEISCSPYKRPLSDRGLFTSNACAKVRGQTITSSAIFLVKRVDTRHHIINFIQFFKAKSCLRVVLLIALIEKPKTMSWLFIAFQKPKKEERNGYKLNEKAGEMNRIWNMQHCVVLILSQVFMFDMLSKIKIFEIISLSLICGAQETAIHTIMSSSSSKIS